MKITENFTLEEFVTSQTASRFGINNTPTDAVIRNIKKLCETILQPARTALGPLIVSSGYRCPQLNSAVGGSKTSAHMEGFAADITPVKVTKLEFAYWVIKNCPFDQVIFEFGTRENPDWIHVSADPRHRKEVWRFLYGIPPERIPSDRSPK